SRTSWSSLRTTTFFPGRNPDRRFREPQTLPFEPEPKRDEQHEQRKREPLRQHLVHPVRQPIQLPSLPRADAKQGADREPVPMLRGPVGERDDERQQEDSVVRESKGRKKKAADECDRR